MASATLKRSEEFGIKVLAQPGIQGVCRILGIVALYDPMIMAGVIETKSQRTMRIELTLNIENRAKATLLVARLRNLVDVRRARLTTPAGVEALPKGLRRSRQPV